MQKQIKARLDRYYQQVAWTPAKPTVTLTVEACEWENYGSLEKMLNCIKSSAEGGSHVTITVSTGGGVQGTFGFDGDGSDKINFIHAQYVGKEDSKTGKQFTGGSEQTEADIDKDRPEFIEGPFDPKQKPVRYDRIGKEK